MTGLHTAWVVLVLTSLGARADGQEVIGVARSVPSSPVDLSVRASEGGLSESGGVSVTADLVNASDREIVAAELLVIGLSSLRPFTVLRIADRITRPVRIGPGGAGQVRARYPYLGRGVIYAVVAVTKVTFGDDTIWAAPTQDIERLFGETAVELGFTESPWPTARRLLEGGARAYVFTEIAFSAGWEGPSTEQGCAAYRAVQPGGVTLVVPNGAAEIVLSRSGDRVQVCDQVAYVDRAEGSP